MVNIQSARTIGFIDRITDTLSKKMVRRVKNRWGVEIWPWNRERVRKIAGAPPQHTTPISASGN
jgi:hypothetical protein